MVGFTSTSESDAFSFAADGAISVCSWYNTQSSINVFPIEFLSFPSLVQIALPPAIV